MWIMNFITDKYNALAAESKHGFLQASGCGKQTFSEALKTPLYHTLSLKIMSIVKKLNYILFFIDDLHYTSYISTIKSIKGGLKLGKIRTQEQPVLLINAKHYHKTTTKINRGIHKLSSTLSSTLQRKWEKLLFLNC